MRNKKKSERASVLITGIEIEGLFGRYDYDLKIPRTADKELSHITLLYGDNGTGKTTILKLLFHLLSPHQGRGHKTFVAQVPFSRFTVAFSDKSRISATRRGSSEPGPYTITFARPRRTLKAKIDTDEENSVTSGTLTTKAAHLLEEIAELGPSIYFLSDERRLESDEFLDESEERAFELVKYEEVRRISHRVSRDPREQALQALRVSLNRATNWLRQKLIQESSRGEAEAQQIYAGIVRRLSKLGVPEAEDYKAERQNLIKALKSLELRSCLFARFGLVSTINVKPLVQGLTSAKQKVHPFIAQVVSNFIDGQRARLDALDELNALLDRFVGLINGFFIDKTIKFIVGEGITILTDSGLPLKPEYLSSGEKQLLLLFCNVLTSSDSASLFIIDEPELSLNVKWQRKLVDALHDVTSGGRCQFLLATHSIELLAKHRKQVVKLDPH